MNSNNNKINLTERAVRRQLQQFGNLVEIGVFFKGATRKEDKMITRTWDADTVIKSLGWLKKQNCAGGNIFVRPAGQTGLVFFDDYSPSMLEDLEKAGLQPAIVSRTSELNYQGWIRISREPLDPEMATAIAQVIARRFGGDYNSADWRHFGRLVGFTNRKPEHMSDDGKFPFVLLDSSSSKCNDNIDWLIAAAKDHLAAKLAEVIVQSGPRSSDANKAGSRFARELKVIYDRWEKGEYGREKFNRSQADWMIARSLYKAGFDFDAIEIAIRENSIKFLEEKPSHAEKYIAETMKKLRSVAGELAGTTA